MTPKPLVLTNMRRVGMLSDCTNGFLYSQISSGWITRWNGSKNSVKLKTRNDTNFSKFEVMTKNSKKSSDDLEIPPDLTMNYHWRHALIILINKLLHCHPTSLHLCNTNFINIPFRKWVLKVCTFKVFLQLYKSSINTTMENKLSFFLFVLWEKCANNLVRLNKSCSHLLLIYNHVILSFTPKKLYNKYKT